MTWALDALVLGFAFGFGFTAGKDLVRFIWWKLSRKRKNFALFYEG